MVDDPESPMRLRIGIDIGWSTSRRTCGVAVHGVPLPDSAGWTPYAPESYLYARRYKLAELFALIKAWREDENLGKYMRHAVVVIDGPIHRTKGCRIDREVDRDWSPWAQPTPLSHPSAGPFIEATEEVIDALGGRDFCWFGESQVYSNRPSAMVIAETNPTVALALMLKQQDHATLPSRTRARQFRNKDAWIRAKSDWYWQIGGGRSVARSLPSEASSRVKGERDHERVAALVCVSLATQLAQESRDFSKAITIGNRAEGIYVVSQNIDETWSGLVNSKHPKGISGLDGERYCSRTEPVFGCDEIALRAYSANVETSGVSAEDYPEFHEDRGDFVDLVLNDDGGVWRQRNPWLEDVGSPLCLEFGGGEHGRGVLRSLRIEHADGYAGSGQWRSVGGVGPSIDDFAKACGHDGELSDRNPIVVRVRIGGR